MGKGLSIESTNYFMNTSRLIATIFFGIYFLYDIVSLVRAPSRFLVINLILSGAVTAFSFYLLMRSRRNPVIVDQNAPPKSFRVSRIVTKIFIFFAAPFWAIALLFAVAFNDSGASFVSSVLPKMFLVVGLTLPFYLGPLLAALFIDYVLVEKRGFLKFIVFIPIAFIGFFIFLFIATQLVKVVSPNFFDHATTRS